MNLTHGSRRYVDVIARWHADGFVEPLIICWPDGRSFQIESIIGKPQSSTFPGAGNRVLRYTVLTEGVRTQLFLEHGEDHSEVSARWYVERRTTTQPWDIRMRYVPHNKN